MAKSAGMDVKKRRFFEFQILGALNACPTLGTFSTHDNRASTRGGRLSVK
ncbi:hypothetical protein PMIT1313_02382 [Prochlorococcus marinus str. MIT 1313]|nr:hypothetical protein PMIT1313_02382 [Prochlorococcus marinus str. MIT 1313]